MPAGVRSPPHEVGAAHPAVLDGERGDLQVIERAPVRTGAADLNERADAACAVGHEGPRYRAQGAGGELRGLGQVRGDAVAAPVTATEPVVVAVVPGRVLMEQRGERGEVAAGEGAEDGPDGPYVVMAMVRVVIGGLLCSFPGRDAAEARAPGPSMVKSISPAGLEPSACAACPGRGARAAWRPRQDPGPLRSG